MRFLAAIIGGTGVGERLAGAGKPIHIPTRFGLVRAKETGGVLLLSRHGAGHSVPPHRVNYTAMSEALRLLEVEHCFSSAAVGGLREDWPPGTICVCSDSMDLSGRETVRFDSVMEHTDMSTPFDEEARRRLLRASEGEKINVVNGGVYVCTNGPRYESPTEIEAIRRLGGDLVGMTAGTEAVTMKEAGIKYACLAIVTNFASGLRTGPLSHEEVVEVMKQSGEKVAKILLRAANT